MWYECADDGCGKSVQMMSYFLLVALSFPVLPPLLLVLFLLELLPAFFEFFLWLPLAYFCSNDSKKLSIFCSRDDWRALIRAHRSPSVTKNCVNKRGFLIVEYHYSLVSPLSILIFFASLSSRSYIFFRFRFFFSFSCVKFGKSGRVPSLIQPLSIFWYRGSSSALLHMTYETQAIVNLSIHLGTQK